MIREYCRLMCVQWLWSQFTCQNRNVNRKWPPWIEIMCAVHIFHRASGVTWQGYGSMTSGQ